LSKKNYLKNCKKKLAKSNIFVNQEQTSAMFNSDKSCKDPSKSKIQNWLEVNSRVSSIH